jgi:hypothetical protein
MHYGFPNAAAAPLFERIGYRTLGTLTRWVRVIRHGSYIERVLINRMLARVSGALLDGVRLAQAAVVKAARGQLVLEPLADADERFDRLWDAAHRQWRVIAWRGAAFVRWRFLRLPGTRCELVALSEPRTGMVRAYAVLDPIESVVHLRDFFGVSLRDLGRLFDLLVPFLYRRGATAISLSFLGSPQVEAMLREHHFFSWKATRPVMVDSAPGAAAPASEDWYLTDADEDT